MIKWMAIRRYVFIYPGQLLFSRHIKCNIFRIIRHIGRFGDSVSITDNYAIVGATGDNNNKGAVYFYYKDAQVIGQALINPSSSSQTNENGVGVSVSGNFAIVGSVEEDYNNLSNSGAAYIYRLNETSSTLSLKIGGESQDNRLGSKVETGNDSAGRYTALISGGGKISVYNILMN